MSDHPQLVRALGSIDHRWRRSIAAVSSHRSGVTTLVARTRLLGSSMARRPERAGRRLGLERFVAGLDTVESSPRRVDLIRFRPPSRRGEAGGIDRVIDECSSSTAELICFMVTTAEPLDPGWLDRLAAVIEGSVVAATPTVIHPERSVMRATPHDLLVRQRGLAVDLDADGVPVLVAIDAGRPVGAEARAAGEIVGATSCLLVDRDALDRAGGLRRAGDMEVALVDLCLRLAQSGGSIRPVAESVLVDTATVGSIPALTRPIAGSSPTWREIIGQHGPALRRSVPTAARELRVAISTAAPAGRIAARWGDWELAQGLARSLGGLGADPLVLTRDQLDDPAGRSCDINLVLRGLEPVLPSPGQRQVLWVISHPDEVSGEDCDNADLVLAASPRLAAHLRTLSSTPVDVLLQGTDHHRFHPVAPEPAYTHQVTVVANTRGVFRSSVADAIAVGLRPAVYGEGWKGIIDDELIMDRHLPNSLLPTVYSSAGVVLNDHWADMRQWGIVSNRIYDVLACGAPVISDHLPEIEEQFGDAVLTYRNRSELSASVQEMFAEPMSRERRAHRGRALVLSHHTLDHRAQELLDLFARYDLLPSS